MTVEVGVEKKKRPRVSPEKIAKLRELAPDHCTAELSKILDIKQATITNLCHRYNITLGKTNPDQTWIRVRLTKEAVAVLVKEAITRDTTLESLVYQLLTNTVNDNLFNAILEDREPRKCKKGNGPLNNS